MITVSFSELETYQQCPMKHLISYKERWVGPEDPDGPRSKGTDWHIVLEAHYDKLMQLQQEYSIRSPERAQGGLYDAWAEQCRIAVQIACADMLPDRIIFVMGMYDRYLGDHGLDSDWKILSTELSGSYPIGEIPCTLSEDDHREGVGPHTEDVHLKYRIDLIVYSHKLGIVLVIDHKSAGQLKQQKVMEIDQQTALYWVAALIVYPDYHVGGAMHNESRKPGKGDPAKSKVPWNRRVRCTHTKRALQAVVENALATVQAMHSPAPVYASPNLDSCGWKCDFLDAHLMIQEGHDRADTLRGFGFVQNFERH